MVGSIRAVSLSIHADVCFSLRPDKRRNAAQLVSPHASSCSASPAIRCCYRDPECTWIYFAGTWPLSQTRSTSTALGNEHWSLFSPSVIEHEESLLQAMYVSRAVVSNLLGKERPQRLGYLHQLLHFGLRRIPEPLGRIYHLGPQLQF